MNRHYHFNVTLHARPAVDISCRQISLGGTSFRVCELRSNQLDRLWDVTFEEASQRLLQLDRVDVEPDGYFLCTGESEAERWQVDGHLYDRDDRVLYVQLKGSCPGPFLDEVLRTVGWPRQPLLFQLTREAVILEEPDFRRYAQREGGPGA